MLKPKFWCHWKSGQRANIQYFGGVGIFVYVFLPFRSQISTSFKLQNILQRCSEVQYVKSLVVRDSTDFEEKREILCDDANGYAEEIEAE